MKKSLLIIALVLSIAASITLGTVAMYNVDVGTVAEGSVTAKAFVVEGGSVQGENSFSYNVKLAPTESTQWQFSVRNFKGSIVSEVPMDLTVNVVITKADGQEAILPLTYRVFDESNNLLGIGKGKPLMAFSDHFPLAAQGQEKVYTVKISWPSTLDDILYQGGGHGSRVTVKVSAVQCLDATHSHNPAYLTDIPDANIAVSMEDFNLNGPIVEPGATPSTPAEKVPTIPAEADGYVYNNKNTEQVRNLFNNQKEFKGGGSYSGKGVVSLLATRAQGSGLAMSTPRFYFAEPQGGTVLNVGRASTLTMNTYFTGFFGGVTATFQSKGYEPNNPKLTFNPYNAQGAVQGNQIGLGNTQSYSLLYFAEGATLTFNLPNNEKAIIPMEGFYYVQSGLNLFDLALYTQVSGTNWRIADAASPKLVSATDASILNEVLTGSLGGAAIDTTAKV